MYIIVCIYVPDFALVLPGRVQKVGDEGMVKAAIGGVIKKLDNYPQDLTWGKM